LPEHDNSREDEAAAINFELMSVILPWISAGNWTDERPRSTHPITHPIGQKQG